MQLVNDHYTIQSVNLTELAQKFGTPLYVYDADKILAQYSQLAQAIAPLNGRIKYAAKALSNLAVLELLKNAGSGLDAVSIEEVQLGLKAGFEPQEILFTPSCVAFEEVKAAVELGVRVNIDDLNILAQFGEEFGSQVPCCVRLNPHITAGATHHLQVGHIDSSLSN